MNISRAKQLEEYTIKNPQEVLIVTIKIGDEDDLIAIFKGFSSSLMRTTAYDPEISVLPESATIISIDRTASPYNPNQPSYIQKNLSWENMAKLFS